MKIDRLDSIQESLDILDVLIETDILITNTACRKLILNIEKEVSQVIENKNIHCDNIIRIYNFKNCKSCIYSRKTNLQDKVSHGELFCIELVRFFSNNFGCNKWSPKQ